MIEIKKKSECCGCTACANICPKNCIEMKEDEEGFLYPHIDKDKCINCGLCEKVCPVRNAKENKFSQKGYIANNLNEDVRKQSSSGGAFSAIANYILDLNGVVFGACFNDKFEVVHSFIEKREELFKFRGSKYAQSNLGDMFKKVKSFLDDGRLVCFSGTPCQIEGLKRFLLMNYENLITVDVMCHAVPSPLILKKYLNYIKENKLGNDEIKNVNFRDKSKYGYKYSTMTVKSDKKIYSRGVETDPYLRAFFVYLSDRPSCYDCKFKKQYHLSDFTIWDCFIAENFDKSLDDDKGTSRILVNTEKGNYIFNQIKGKLKYIEIDPNLLVKNVKEMLYSVKINPNRHLFFKDSNAMNDKDFFEKWFPDSLKVKLERSIRIFLTKTGIYKEVKKYLKKILRK